MASGGRHFNDSSGDASRLEQRPQRFIPDALELKALPVTRDSGCFTGSPMTAASSDRSPSQFPFDGASPAARSHTTHRMGDYPLQSTPVIEGEQFYPEGINLDSGDEDDDVFHLSEDSFVDSGLQGMSLSNQAEGRTGSYLVKPYKQYRQEETTSYSDEESSTASGDFSTAEFELGMDESFQVVSRPIDIPARTPNSSPEVDEPEEVPVPRLHHHHLQHHQLAGSLPSAAPVLLRRATEGHMIRPHSGGPRVPVPRDQFYSQSVEGAHGPLPDVVPGLRRNRAMSESAIHSQQYLTRVGTSLRDMCDEFSTTTINRQRNLHLIQERQKKADEPGQTPKRERLSSSSRRGSSGNFLSRLFSSSQE